MFVPWNRSASLKRHHVQPSLNQETRNGFTDFRIQSCFFLVRFCTCPPVVPGTQEPTPLNAVWCEAKLVTCLWTTPDFMSRCRILRTGELQLKPKRRTETQSFYLQPQAFISNAEQVLSSNIAARLHWSGQDIGLCWFNSPLEVFKLCKGLAVMPALFESAPGRFVSKMQQTTAFQAMGWNLLLCLFLKRFELSRYGPNQSHR